MYIDFIVYIYIYIYIFSIWRRLSKTGEEEKEEIREDEAPLEELDSMFKVNVRA